ncbi:MAG: hypothetical protein J5543_09860 [Bacteroidales bacterium]|nr:hypothetical protein [Bacteroidales bacterium]
MDTTTILRQAENLASDEEKLMLLGDFLGENMNSLETMDLIRLLTPLVDITRRIYEQNPDHETISDYVTALIKLADNYIRDERGWLAMPLLVKAEELLDNQPDTEENAQWKCHSYFDIGECYTMNTRRLMAKKALQKALHYAISEEDKENCEYSLDRLENPMLKYDPVEDSDAYLSVIDEVERRLYEELKDVPRHMGFCFRYWSAKRELLAKYGIEWRSPGIMNPRVMFD